MPTLVAGARLVMMSTDVWDITEFHKKVSESGLTVLNVPTSYWQELARHWAGLSELVPDIQAQSLYRGRRHDAARVRRSLASNAYEFDPSHQCLRADGDDYNGHCF